MRGQGYSDSKMAQDTPASQDASSHQIRDSYLKCYKRYAPDIIVLQARSEVKVTLTRKWYTTLHRPKTHSYTKFWNSYLKEYRRYAPDSMRILETRLEVKVKVTVTKGW